MKIQATGYLKLEGSKCDDKDIYSLWVTFPSPVMGQDEIQVFTPYNTDIPKVRFLVGGEFMNLTEPEEEDFRDCLFQIANVFNGLKEEATKAVILVDGELGMWAEEDDNSRQFFHIKPDSLLVYV
tara:strand:- start:548 stop:922 length:375 start_codon:yes stop_codon:yes gene_type:complete